MRIYDIDGLEMDVQDPTFFIDETYYKSLLEAIKEVLDVYF